MDRSQVRGILFIQVFEQAAGRWGSDAAESLQRSAPDPEAWYPMADFCALLNDIKSKLGNNNPLSIYLMGFGTMKNDPAWQGTFAELEPADVFTSTERQDLFYRAGSHAATLIGPKHVRVEVSCPGCGQAWFEFYRGRLQGVLELTGRTGVVHLIPGGEEGRRAYDIKWG